MRERSFDVAALGELLIDFTENGTSGQGNPLFEANPGGAPCNVLAMLARLGRKTAFIGKVGDDFFGHYLQRVITDAGICADALCMTALAPTTLALVHTDETGDRDFSFYRNPGADVLLTEADVPEDVIAACKIFHFGSLSLTHPDARSATKRAVALAKKYGCLLSFDPNLRKPLWDNMEEARAQIACGISVCDILKISDNEIRWFTGEQDFDAGIEKIRARFDPKLIVLSKGRVGSSAYWGTKKADAPAFLNPHTIETTGAGDTFCACVLHSVLAYTAEAKDRKEASDMLQKLSEESVRRMLLFANAAASIVTTRKGALRVMPTPEEVNILLGGN